ncbi:XRE family transcriptional regulator [Agromyces atrinae]|uniref:helix-turn-helix transcriptional regulator n=1 Tax=Agromyces atrinae TaxID=592376 RepID=UPI001F59B5B4|nr:XRE family transcriptional regulator [Agromyces atrinae]MCI2958232.1 XRE family transcriptional regulator [Agromyces atrinae]
MRQKKPKRYLSTVEVAERLGVQRSTLGRYKLPTPDVMIGETRGWTAETIDAWNEARPGSGRWGTAEK